MEDPSPPASRDVEHRRHRRVDIPLPVELTRQGTHYGFFQTGNLCRDGLFIDALTTLERNQCVGITLLLAGTQYRLRGCVVHRTPQGAGLVLLETNRDFAESLDLLRPKQYGASYLNRSDGGWLSLT